MNGREPREHAADMPNDRAAADRRQLREIVDRWFPLADWQREKLSLLLNPGRGRRGAG